MKRVLSLILAVSMVMSMFTFSFAGTTLKDVVDTDYEAAVEALVELGIVNGYEDGTYRPEQNVSRAEMAKLLVVAAGLEPAAKLAEGATKFADVNGGWASGYVNVASEYGYVMGDPDGNFRPDDTVSYAEAATMALRVLGYKSVVEAKGTWPTNYIAKAEDLELLEDITYASYNDGAARGNVAILIWNMLTTAMWDVTGESDGDGLIYEDTVPMLNVKFPDYTYGTVDFERFEINGDGEVIVYLEANDAKDTFRPSAMGYEYLENDFYTFVPGTEVEVLVNDEDEVLLTMVRTGADKLVEGIKEDIDEDYDDLVDAAYLYVYGLVERKHIVSGTIINAVSEYIFEVNTSNKNYVKFNDKSTMKFYYDDEEYEIYLKDGERATVEDVKVGDVLTEVTVSFPVWTYDEDEEEYVESTDTETFYMIGSSEVEGKLTKVVVEDFKGPEVDDEGTLATFTTATIGKEEYPVADEAMYVEDTEDMDDQENFDADTWASAIGEKMNGEEVTAVLDVFGRVVMVLFDGEIDAGEDEDDLTVKFVAVTGPVDRDGDYTLPVVTEDGEDTLVFADRTLGNQYWRTDIDLEGYFALVALNEDGEIESFKALNEVALVDDEDADFPGFSYRESGDLADGTLELAELLTYELGETAEEDDSYVVTVIPEATYSKDEKALTGAEDPIKVGSKTVVVTLVFDDKGTTNKTSDDEYRVTFSTGIGEIDNMKKDLAVVITDDATVLGDAKYVVIFDDVATGENDLVGIVSSVDQNRIGEWLLTITETRITDSKELKEAKKDAMLLNERESKSVEAIKNGEVAMVLYSTEVNKDDELEVIVEKVILNEELDITSNFFATHGYVANEDEDGEISEDGRRFVMFMGETSVIVDLDDEDYTIGEGDDAVAYDFEDYRYIIVNVELADEDDTDEVEYAAESFKEVDFADVEVKYEDRISADPDAEIVVIYRGFPAEEDIIGE